MMHEMDSFIESNQATGGSKTQIKVFMGIQKWRFVKTKNRGQTFEKGNHRIFIGSKMGWLYVEDGMVHDDALRGSGKNYKPLGEFNNQPDLEPLKTIMAHYNLLR